MNLDVRLPIGLLFGLVGLILTAYGAFSDAAIYQRSLGINVNLWWGLFLVAFGAVMLAQVWRGSATPNAPPAEGSAAPDAAPGVPHPPAKT